MQIVNPYQSADQTNDPPSKGKDPTYLLFVYVLIMATQVITYTFLRTALSLSDVVSKLIVSISLLPGWMIIHSLSSTISKNKKQEFFITSALQAFLIFNIVVVLSWANILIEKTTPSPRNVMPVKIGGEGKVPVAINLQGQWALGKGMAINRRKNPRPNDS